MGFRFDMIKMLLKRADPAFKRQIKTINIKNKKVKYAQIDKQTPTIVFENGFGVGMKLWNKIFLEISKTNIVFAYDRSDRQILKDNIMTSDMVEHLRALLKERGVKPPYILVGHSLGGLNVQYFAKKYPQEVAGVVLVDSTHPDDFEDTSHVPKSQLKVLEHIAKCGQEVLSLKYTKQIPMSALIATYESSIKKYPKKLAIQIEIMKKRMEEFPKLYPNCQLQWVDSGHFIMHEKPDVVIEAIKDILKEV